ncbi:hypothetical protein FRC03_005087 [Tulasnella sp. 419]|nr:hypothetical protein FRC02_001663 [Tulasnella sp. 418]KAG8961679.1 hypothetical protein FRC03_005087 [Tulasnella sp. 419]
MFKFISTTFIASLIFAAPTTAAPLTRRQADPTDLLVLKFAGVLERFETGFYEQALAKFQDSDFTSAGFGNVNVPKQLFTTILDDEKAHTSILESTIKANGGEPITTCQFDFSAALKDVATMAAVARVVEYVGVSGEY